ncbi:protein TSSC4 [Trichogramma pretiosum]|uniref:protein TSSC4 n=1 Tax=Trichogramma pretiosum TaxID=7493 RepID=UPI0006C97513|nr:protein TSSC4 [Trichogramma pretiosum]XP_014232898.1 protein TSSC4 [Trichogramma pretiosum]
MGPDKKLTDSTPAAFIERKKKLFDVLHDAEKSLNKHNNHTNSRVPKIEQLKISGNNVEISNGGKNRIHGYRGRQSIYNRPEGPAPRANIRTIPDYRINPDKWTCYSLNDVSDISNDSNRAAAFSFLSELKNRKNNAHSSNDNGRKKLKSAPLNEVSILNMEVDNDSVQEDTNSGIITFKKPKKKVENNKPEIRPEFRKSKVIMPEYEVGTRKIDKKKTTKKSNVQIDKKNLLKLNHLDEIDDV